MRFCLTILREQVGQSVMAWSQRKHDHAGWHPYLRAQTSSYRSYFGRESTCSASGTAHDA